MRTRCGVCGVMCMVTALGGGGLAAGCGDDSRERPDAAVPVDAAVADVAVLEPPPPTAPQVAIRVYPNGFPYTGPTANASLVALQDGDGEWRPLTGTDGVYRAEVKSARYAVAVMCGRGLESATRLYYQAVSDTAELHTLGCRREQEDAQVHVSMRVAGFKAPQHAEIWVGPTSRIGDVEGRVELDVRPGPAEYLVKSYLVENGAQVPVKLYRGPTLELTTNQIEEVDLGIQGVGAERHPLVLLGREKSETAQLDSSYATPHSEVAWPIASESFVIGDPTSYATIGAEGRRPEDVSNLTATVSRTSQLESRTYARTVQVARATSGAATLQLPAPWTLTSPLVDRAMVPRVTVVLPLTAPTLARSDYHVELSTTQLSVPANTISLTVRPSWAEGAGTVTITTPDLSQLPGWSPDLALRRNMPVDWTATRTDRSLADDALPVDGRVILENRVSGRSFPTPR